MIATIVFYCTLGCMAAQVNYEVDWRKEHGGNTHNANRNSNVVHAEAEVVRYK
jgi:hypothetical protein